MLSDVASLTDVYLSWVNYEEHDIFIIIEQKYMNKKDGKDIFKLAENTPKLIIMRTYKRGVYHGISKNWYRSGEIQSICRYKYDELTGVFKRWYENGQLEFKRFYINGQLYGKETVWYPDGRIRYEKYWLNGLQKT